MESKLNEKVLKLQGCQERKLQLEENIQRLQPQLRDMKNTLEKYTNSMTVRLYTALPFHLLSNSPSLIYAFVLWIIMCTIHCQW